MSAETITPFQINPSAPNPNATDSDTPGGGAGRGGSGNGPGSPLVVVQQGRSSSPPRPAPNRSQGNSDNSLRNGYAAISHSVSGETAAIGIGFLLAGPVGAIIGGTIAPAALAALMWRSRQAEHDQNSNDTSTANRSADGADRSTGGTNGTGTRGHNNAGNNHGGRNNTPNGGGHSPAGPNRKPKTKDPVLDKLSKSLDKLKPSKGSSDTKGPKNKTPRDSYGSDKARKGPKGSDNGKSSSNDRTKVRDPKGRGPQADSDRPWHGRGNKPDKPKKNSKSSGDKSATARDALEPKKPNSDGSTNDEILDAEIVDDGLPPKPTQAPGDVIDGEVIDEDRIALVRKKREKTKRRQAITKGKKAAERAARDGNQGDPHQVKVEVIRDANHRIDLELHYENQLLELTAATETRRSTPVNYPAIQASPAGTRTAGVAIARQIDFRGATAYAILRAMAEQLAYGLHNDDDADMADHIIELTGIPNMCKNLSVAVQEAARALARTAPLHPSVVKHLNQAAIAARTAGVMAENIMTVFVQAHRDDIIRVLDPRIGEERWNIRNAPGTLDAAKLRAAIATANNKRLALPAGNTPASGSGKGGSKLVPASDGSTKKLINLMKGFTRGHMVVVLSEVAGSAAGIDAVADSIGKLYKRMQNTWPTENIVDDTVARTAGQVRRVSDELRKAIRAAQKAHQRELRLNAKGRAGKGAVAERKWDVAGRPASSN